MTAAEKLFIWLAVLAFCAFVWWMVIDLAPVAMFAETQNQRHIAAKWLRHTSDYNSYVKFTENNK